MIDKLKGFSTVTNWYYGIMSLLYLVVSIKPMSVLVDTVWFRKMAYKFSFPYISFALWRYENWSSRLLIESITAFYARYTTLFVITVFLAIFFLFKGLSLLLDAEMDKGNLSVVGFFIPWVYLLIMYPTVLTGAGYMPTTTNYVFPIVMFLWGMLFLGRGKYIASSLMLLFSVENEQLAVFGFVFGLAFAVFQAFKCSKVSIKYILLLLVSSVGLLNAVFCPGARARFLTEAHNWYKSFNDLNFFDKIYSGLAETIYQLLYLGIFNLLAFLIAIGLVVGILRMARGGSFLTFFVSIVLGLIVVNIKVLPVLGALGDMITPKDRFVGLVTESGRVGMWSNFGLLTVISVVLVAYVMLLLPSRMRGVGMAIILSGVASRLMMGFSPTLYVSAERTFIVMVLSFALLGLYALGAEAKQFGLVQVKNSNK